MTEKRYFKTLQQGMTLLELTVVLLVLIALAGLAMPYIGGTGRTAMCQTTDAAMQAAKQAIMGGAAGAGFYGNTLGGYPKATKGVATADYNLTYLFSVPTDSSWGGMVSFNAKTAVGWRGPYLMSGGAAIPSGLGGSFAEIAQKKVHVAIDLNAGSQVLDAWGRPLVLQVPNPASCDKLTNKTGSKEGECARLVSAGSGSGLGSGEADIDTLIDDEPSTAGIIEARRSNDDRMLYLRIPSPAGDANIPCDQS